MIKNLKLKVVLTTIITFLPCLAGILLWDKLPEMIPTHFGYGGEANGYSSKAFAVFFIPLFLAVMNLLCVFMTASDPKHKNISGKMFNIIFFICPIISVLVGGIMYLTALGIKIDVSVSINVFVGVLFIVIGNYLPKCKQNYTTGVKLPWTMNDEDNWNKTNRFTGYIMTFGGIAIVIAALFNAYYVTFIFIIVMAFAPAVYSYLHYRKAVK